MHIIEPEYKNYIPAMKLRRMSRVVKMGVTAALQCLETADVEIPDAVITATGWGCLADTFKFLGEIGEKNEETLSPATFIQSTHNTVGGQIALMLECQEYNSVYVHDSSSFEHGLLDAMMLLKEGKKNVLIGGIDEISEIDFMLKDQAGWWKKEPVTQPIFQSNSSGTLAGEGASFFLLGNKNENTNYTCVEDVSLSPGKDAVVILHELLSANDLVPNDIDLVISGINGDKLTNKAYLDFVGTQLVSAQHCCYKHLTGEFDSASAFSLWLADQILKTRSVPEYIKVNKSSEHSSGIQNILIYHLNKASEHAFILVSKTGL
jgi:hypothetical protein